MAGSGDDERSTLEFTPTWVVAVLCTVIVGISLAVERIIHYTGKYLKKKNQKPLYEALQKVKAELMLLGFISLLLAVLQNSITKICVKESVTLHLLPCKLPSSESSSEGASSNTTETTSHHRRLLAEESPGPSYCALRHLAPLLSVEALHHLHIFIFVLAIVHVTFCVLTVLFGGAKIRQWKHWEDYVLKDNFNAEQVLKPKITAVDQHEFIRDHFLGVGKNSAILGWLVFDTFAATFAFAKALFLRPVESNYLSSHCFFKQFYGSVTKSDYMTLRLGFIMTHCRGNLKFNFHKYMIRALEDDFREVVGISWYLWIFVVVFLLLNVSGWHTYFWITFVPFILLLAVGTKLEHVIIQLAHEVAEKHAAIEGELVVKPSDNHFWFHRPNFVFFLIHFILFQNAFEMGFIFWIWVQYGFHSCIMDKVHYIVPRLVIGAFVQVLCSYSTLPLYAIVTQMGSSFKRAIFDEHVQMGIIGWAEKAKRKKQLKAATDGSSGGNPTDGSSANKVGIQLGRVCGKGSAPEEIQPPGGGAPTT